MSVRTEWLADAVAQGVKTAVDAELQKIAADLQKKSAAQAPVDTAALKNDCSARVADGKAEVFYSLPYARTQHERLDIKHLRGGKAKFLEDPLNENSARYEAGLLEAVRKGFDAK